MRTGVATARLGPLAVLLSSALGCSAVGAERAKPSVVAAAAAAAADAVETETRVLRFAGAQVGKRYCWGGTGPFCFDCSGLVQTAWASVGVRLPRTADAIAAELPEVPLEANQLRAGDILWWPGHVGLYAGDGWVVEALDRHHGVVRRPLVRAPYRAFRPWGWRG